MSFDKRLINYWDEYYKKEHVPSFPSPFVKYVANQLIPELDILEIGCGNGRDSKFLSSKGHNVTGIDRSSKAIELCINLYPDESIEFVCGTISGLVLRKFDLIYSRFVIHAMSLDEEIETLKMCYGLLKEDGKLFIECRSIKDPLSCKGESLSHTEKIDGHYRRFIILEEFTQRLAETGFEVIKTIENKGLAKFGEEDPVIIRVKAIKKSS